MGWLDGILVPKKLVVSVSNSIDQIVFQCVAKKQTAWSIGFLRVQMSLQKVASRLCRVSESHQQLHNFLS